MTAIPVLYKLLSAAFVTESSACSVCFGADGSDLPKAFTLGITVLLVATFAILASLAYAMFKIEKARAENEA